MINSLIIAFSMYSRIPMPRVEWREESMKYVMCFFPLIGIIIGVVVYIAGKLMLVRNVSSLLFAAVVSVIPIVITGGIHMDGFIDTADALSSYGDKEKKLEIMKDPHTGAFAIIWTAVYFILCLGLWSAVKISDMTVIAIGYAVSRTLSGLSVVCFKTANGTGLAYMFRESAQKKRVRAALAVWLVIEAAALIVIGVKYAAATAIAAVAVFICHYYVCRKHFGGITGDLAGCFLQICELAMLAAAVIV
ncbi:MAG: adenosylcobinamide-GDP ribazoletransferase [Candidatus Ornithomonoglobus sp.]